MTHALPVCALACIALRRAAPARVRDVVALPCSVVCVDEIDCLSRPGRSALLPLFTWPGLPGSSLILIGTHSAAPRRWPRGSECDLRRCGAGIGNRVNMVETMSPAMKRARPRVLLFETYSEEQLVAIVRRRCEVAAAEGVVEPRALQLAARGVSQNGSGDARKLLEMVAKAIGVLWCCGLGVAFVSLPRARPGHLSHVPHTLTHSHTHTPIHPQHTHARIRAHWSQHCLVALSVDCLQYARHALRVTKQRRRVPLAAVAETAAVPCVLSPCQ
jgi:hypothetical protein